MPENLIFLIACLGTAQERVKGNVQTMSGAEQRLWNLCAAFPVQSSAFSLWIMLARRTYGGTA